MNSYTVTLDTPRGTFDVDLNATNTGAAQNRAWLSLVHAGYGDLDEVVVVDCTDNGQWSPPVKERILPGESTSPSCIDG